MAPFRPGSGPQTGFKRRLQRTGGLRAEGEGSIRGEAVDSLNARFAKLSPRKRCSKKSLLRRWPGSIAVLSSFGAEAAITLHLTAQIDRFIPVLS